LSLRAKSRVTQTGATHWAIVSTVAAVVVTSRWALVTISATLRNLAFLHARSVVATYSKDFFGKCGHDWDGFCFKLTRQYLCLTLAHRQIGL
jgi:hypothetical protein